MSTLLVENIKHEDATDIAIVLAANGTLGIGTVGTARNDPLTVKGLNNIAKFESSAAAVELRVNTPTVDKIGLTTGTNDNFFINVGGSDRLYVANGGNVGIGTDNPGYKLHVQGGTLGLFASGANTTAPSLTWGTSSSHILRTEDSELAIGLDNSAPYNLYLQARTNANFERPIIINPVGGNVGIGTRNPTTKLHVNGDLKVENGVIKLPAFASDPGSPAAGDMYYNTTDNAVKHYDGNQWISMSNKFSASGGTEGTFSTGGVNYKYHRFTSSGTFTVDTNGAVDVLVVAGGGGGGGGRHASGAGAGGLIYQTGVTLSSGTYSIVVGAGGAGGGTTGPASTNGANSSAFGLTAIGGGAGGNHGITPNIEQGQSGGSGGGSAHTTGLAPGSGTVGQGNAGSRNVPDRSVCPSGGGAGGPGVANGTGNENTATGSGDEGGPGLQYNMDGNNHYYAGGGGGSASPNDGSGDAWAGGNGGIGGGGGGGSASNGAGGRGGYGGGSALNTGGNGAFGIANGSCSGGSGGANTGGGGGGAGGWSSNGNGPGGQGGSGVVIIRYVV